MTGKLKLKGDMGAAMKLQKLFPDNKLADGSTFYYSSSSTRMAPPATRSPSATCTARTVAS